MPEDYQPIKKESKNRRDIEMLLEKAGISLEKRISILNLDTGEVRYFDDYPEALEFMKGKKGRWYLTTPGIRYDKSLSKKEN